MPRRPSTRRSLPFADILSTLPKFVEVAEIRLGKRAKRKIGIGHLAFLPLVRRGSVVINGFNPLLDIVGRVPDGALIDRPKDRQRSHLQKIVSTYGFTESCRSKRPRSSVYLQQETPARNIVRISRLLGIVRTPPGTVMHKEQVLVGAVASRERNPGACDASPPPRRASVRRTGQSRPCAGSPCWRSGPHPAASASR